MTSRLAVTLWLVGVPSSYGAVLNFDCPKKISVTTKVDQVPTPWTYQQIDKEALLERATIFYGDPVDRAELAPDNKGKKANPAVWTLHHIAGSGLRHRVVCAYRDTSVVLSQELPPETNKCSIKYSADGYSGVEKIECE